MGLFDGWKLGRREPEASWPTLDELAERARAGDTQGALTASTEKLAHVEKQRGAATPAYAAALFEHASLCLLLGMARRAVGAMRTASEIRGNTREDEKNRLTYLMNLGDMLAYAGELEEALAVHQQGLAQREQFYGKQHPGYAYGLDSWADVAIALGRNKESLEAAQQSLAIYDAAGHERVPHAWGLIFLAAGGMKATWKELQIPPAMAHAILADLANRQLPAAPTAELAAVTLLTQYARDDDVILQSWGLVERRAMKAGDHVTRLAALERIREIAEARHDRDLVLDAELGIALTHDKAGRHEDAARHYERAIEQARANGNPADTSKALRNAGLYFVQHDADRGLALLREAADAREARGEERARSRIALGIQLQHRGELAEARDRLAGGLAEIDASHPDAICGRSHLRAIEEKHSCGCGDVGGEIHAQVERIVRERLPEGMLDRIVFDGDNVGIHVTRALTEDEARLVADTVDLAMSEMRNRIRATYG